MPQGIMNWRKFLEKLAVSEGLGSIGKMKVVVFCIGLLSLFFLSVFSLIYAESEDSVPSNLTAHRDLEYASVNGKSLKLDLFVPPKSSKPTPVIVWVHGGGWQAGDKSIIQPIPILKSGFAVASINYRFSQEARFPAQLYDCKAAVRWVRAHANEYGLDPNKIAAAGDSAGGQLVALLGTTSDHPELEGTEGNLDVSSNVQAVCDFFGPTDFPNWNKGNPNPQAAESPNDPIAKLIGGLIVDNLDKARAASPVTYVSAKACPFFISHGDWDTVVPLAQSIELNDALQKAGVPSTLYVVSHGGHEFKSPEAYNKALAFLKQYLQGS
jgi:acetyl esterase/lipase